MKFTYVCAIYSRTQHMSMVQKLAPINVYLLAWHAVGGVQFILLIRSELVLWNNYLEDSGPMHTYLNLNSPHDPWQ